MTPVLTETVSESHLGRCWNKHQKIRRFRFSCVYCNCGAGLCITHLLCRLVVTYIVLQLSEIQRTATFHFHGGSTAVYMNSFPLSRSHTQPKRDPCVVLPNAGRLARCKALSRLNNLIRNEPRAKCKAPEVSVNYVINCRINVQVCCACSPELFPSSSFSCLVSG